MEEIGIDGCRLTKNDFIHMDIKDIFDDVKLRVIYVENKSLLVQLKVLSCL